MLVKISMEVSPYGTENGNNKRSVEIIRTPETFELNDELKQHLFEVLFVFFEPEKVSDFLEMHKNTQKVPIIINGKKSFLEIKAVE